MTTVVQHHQAGAGNGLSDADDTDGGNEYIISINDQRRDAKLRELGKQIVATRPPRFLHEPVFDGSGLEDALVCGVDPQVLSQPLQVLRLLERSPVMNAIIGK